MIDKTKFYLLSSIVICCSFFSLGQTTNQEKIVAVYGQEWYNREFAENKQMIDFLNEYLTHGFLIKNVSEGKYSEFEPLVFIPLVSKNNDSISVEEFLIESQKSDFNPLKYRFFPTYENQIFKLAGVDKIIYIEPMDFLINNADD